MTVLYTGGGGISVIEQKDGGPPGIEVVIDVEPADPWREVPSGSICRRSLFISAPWRPFNSGKIVLQLIVKARQDFAPTSRANRTVMLIQDNAHHREFGDDSLDQGGLP